MIRGNTCETDKDQFSLVETALGWLKVRHTSRGIVEIQFAGLPEPEGKFESVCLPKPWRDAICRAASGESFECPPLDLQGTDFQKAVWEELTRIPLGCTHSYKEVAAAIGRPRATRAVGAACGANPVPLLIPCHRVLRADGALGGFSAGISIKKSLLAMEDGAGHQANTPWVP